MNSLPDHRPFNLGALFITSALAAAAFLVLGVIAFTRPASRTFPVTTPYTQQVQFGYSAHARRGLVYPDGAISTGDPIFLTLVHNVAVSIDYRLSTNAPSAVTGTEEVLLQLTGPSGWTHDVVLTPPTLFRSNHTSTEVTLNIPAVASMIARIYRLTGGGSFAGDSFAVVPEVHLKGTVAGQPINTSLAPALSLEIGPTQLVFAGVSASASSAASAGGTSTSSPTVGYSQTETGVVTTGTNSAPTSLTVLGVSPTISLLRWIALIGLLLSASVAVYAFLRRRAEPFQETAHIQSHYGHLIVPIVAGEDLGWPAVDVTTIKALAKLAESGQRLILHSRAAGVDTYLVNDEGTVYRYQVRPSKLVWGEWSNPAPPLEEAA